jgi:drug/metabolite transporter (DMT)-like permease
MSDHSSVTLDRSVAVPGFVWAGLGVLAFSFTFPATVLAERSLDPTLVGAGRSVLAAALAVLFLCGAGASFPAREHWAGLITVALGCGIGFGLLSAVALPHTSSTHAAVVIGVLPAVTAIIAVVRNGERPSLLFWAASALGGGIVVVYALSRRSGSFGAPDLLLVAALLVTAMGYAEGGRIARSIPDWQVMAWGVLFALPISLPITVVALFQHPPGHVHPSALAGFVYIGAVSMLIGLYAWYRGLAKVGIARASQIQLTQPLLTIFWSSLILGDRLDGRAVVAAIGVSGCVLITQRSRVSRSAVGRNATSVFPAR